jgi:hypothetical protein
MINKAFHLVKPGGQGEIEPPAFRFQAHPQRCCMWLDVA